MTVKELVKIHGVTITPNKVLKNLFHVSINGKEVLSFKKHDGNVFVFPYYQYFSNNTIQEMSESAFADFVEVFVSEELTKSA